LFELAACVIGPAEPEERYAIIGAVPWAHRVIWDCSEEPYGLRIPFRSLLLTAPLHKPLAAETQDNGAHRVQLRRRRFAQLGHAIQNAEERSESCITRILLTLTNLGAGSLDRRPG
jgi:hypothetical protein